MKKLALGLVTALALTFSAPVAAADLSTATYRGRVCRTDGLHCYSDGCYWQVVVAVTVFVNGGLTQEPFTVKCDPSYPAVVAICQAGGSGQALGTCVQFSGSLVSLSFDPWFLILDATSALLPDDSKCTPEQNTFGPC